ncbi:MAG: ABC transporter permease [Candidatus Rokubacteria bacterium]|nr:ABC transporter permease [Candidatus Rokubacteria bacterium]
MASSIHGSAADGGAAVPGALPGVQAPPAAPDRLSRRRELARELVRRKTALAGLVLAVAVIGGALLAPLLAPADPLAMSARRFATPSAEAWLGTDQFGRDLASRLLYGARVSMLVAFSAVAAATVAGTAIGLLAGYLGGKVDYVLMRAVEVLMAFPTLLLALAVVATFGGSLRNLVFAIGLAYVPVFSRVVRGSTLSVTHLEFVQAARALGARDGRIMLLQVLPNVLAPIIVQATFNLSTAIMIEAALSFLGLGVQPPAPSWGTMLSEARGFMELDPWLAIAPGAAITLAVLAFNLFGDGLRDILDPRLAGER